MTASAHPWLGVELRHLAALIAVVEEGSFVRAAARLGYTQSAVSSQIAGLERLVGSRLVERGRGTNVVALTRAGQVLHEHAVALTARLEAARADVAAARPDAEPALRIGYFQSVGASVLPRIAQTFRERCPGVALRLELGGADRLQQEVVAAGELDLAFVSAPIRVETLRSVHLYDDPFALLASAEEVRQRASRTSARGRCSPSNPVPRSVPSSRTSATADSSQKSGSSGSTTR